MKAILLLFFSPVFSLKAQILFLKAQNQEFSINTLVNFTALTPEKFNVTISRAGFKPNFGWADSTRTFFKISKDKSIERQIAKTDKSHFTSLLYQTTSLKEYEDLVNDLVADGYSIPKNNAENNSFPLYQKGSITIRPSILKDSSIIADSIKIVYGFYLERKRLPQANEIHYAEDLLQLTSHEYIVSVFGTANVKKDIFYLSKNEVNKCSVLFPNTSLEVIFVWKDEVNSRGISFLLISGQTRTKSSLNFSSQVELNKWQSTRGIYLGMSLKELNKLNEKPIDFYGWESEEAGFVIPGNTGSIDFKGLEVELNCLDCNEDRYYTNTKIINSNSVLKDNRRVYVSTMVVIPPK
ncbi:MAG: hypothetical protein M3O67_09210 [Bacteroidota bacterium]|nr:hypothetical protein [Bacteroidota bacterium]